jgi:uncharacterized protein YcfL
MKTPKLPLLAGLFVATFLLVACGDDKPSDSLTKEDVICQKMLKYGASCNSATGTNSTAVTTQTVTITNTATGS